MARVIHHKDGNPLNNDPSNLLEIETDPRTLEQLITRIEAESPEAQWLIRSFYKGANKEDKYFAHVCDAEFSISNGRRGISGKYFSFNYFAALMMAYEYYKEARDGQNN